MTDRVVGQELDQAALKYMREHREVSYSQALEAAMADNPTLASEYVAEFNHVSGRQARAFGIEDAGDEDSSTIAAEKEIDRLVQAWLADHPTERDNYSKGLSVVLARHPDLAMRWRKNYNPGTAKFSTSENFEHVVVVEHEQVARAAEDVDALMKEIKKEHPDWTDEDCLREVRVRMEKKGKK